MKNNIGLDKDHAQVIAQQLNLLLADYQMFYQNLRSYHWNIRGRAFFSFHEKFEEYYNETNDTIDELAERILTLGFTPYHSFGEYLEHAKLPSAKLAGPIETVVETVIENIQYLLEKERELITLAADKGDEGTVALIGEDIARQEKKIWMLSAFLK